MLKRADWNHYTFTYGDGRDALVAFDVRAAVLPCDGHPHGVRVLFVGEVEEEALAARLVGVDCLLVGRLGYAGRVEFVLQVEDLEGFRSREAALAGLGARVEHTPGWDYFHSRVSPTPADWRRIEDREALARLGLDGDRRVRVLHHFFGDAKALDALRERLGPEAFEVERADGRRLSLAHVHPIGDITKVTLGLMRLCERLGVAYEGWVVPGG
jgi:hypothetical protein